MQEKILSNKKNGMLMLLVSVLLYFCINSAYCIRRDIRYNAALRYRHTLGMLGLDAVFGAEGA